MASLESVLPAIEAPAWYPSEECPCEQNVDYCRSCVFFQNQQEAWHRDDIERHSMDCDWCDGSEGSEL